VEIQMPDRINERKSAAAYWGAAIGSALLGFAPLA
jgi:hypothetical protein